jgi:hypothetical protein
MEPGMYYNQDKQSIMYKTHGIASASTLLFSKKDKLLGSQVEKNIYNMDIAFGKFCRIKKQFAKIFK